MDQIRKRIEAWKDTAWFKTTTMIVYSLILPICFYFSIFDEPLFNKLVVILGFVVFCVFVFGAAPDWGRSSYVDRYVLVMVVAAILTTLRAADFMADTQAIAYTHIEELERLLAAGFLGTFLYHRKKECFEVGMQIISWMIWGTAVYQIVLFVPLLKNAEGITSISALESFMDTSRWILSSVYRNPIPCCTCFVIGCALPLIHIKWLDLALKLVYIPAIFVTYARSGWVGTMVLVVLVLYVAVRKRKGKIGRWWILIIGIPAAATVLLYILTVVYGKRLGGSVGRVKYWIYMLTVMFPKLSVIKKFFGTGFYTSIVMDQTPVSMPGFPALDNAFMTIFYEQGTLGFAAVLMLLWRAVKEVWKVGKDWIYGVALIAACATACFYEMHFWTHAGFLAAVFISVFFGRCVNCRGTVEEQESG